MRDPDCSRVANPSTGDVPGRSNSRRIVLLAMIRQRAIDAADDSDEDS